MSDLTGPRFELQTSRFRDERATARPTKEYCGLAVRFIAYALRYNITFIFITNIGFNIHFFVYWLSRNLDSEHIANVPLHYFQLTSSQRCLFNCFAFMMSRRLGRLLDRIYVSSIFTDPTIPKIFYKQVIVPSIFLDFNNFDGQH